MTTKYQVRIVSPEGVEEVAAPFKSMEDATEWADDLIMGMDTTEARETLFEVSRSTHFPYIEEVVVPREGDSR